MYLKKIVIIFLIIFIFTPFFYTCKETKKGEKLALKNCSSCHLFPKPELLPKQVWKNNVLPEMGFLLGMGTIEDFLFKKGRLDNMESSIFREIFPKTPQLSENQWTLIQEYYINNAPDSLEKLIKINIKTDLHKWFSIKTIKKDIIPCATCVAFDTSHDEFLMASYDNQFHIYDSTFKLKQKLNYNSPVSFFKRHKDTLNVLLMGRMDPNNLPLGYLAQSLLSKPNSMVNNLASNLHRPVFFEEADFNKDGIKDYLISSFGYYLGKLSLFTGHKNGNYSETILSSMPGSIKTRIIDLNKDGYDDFLVLMAQGNEGVYLYNNLKNGNFLQKALIRLPPTYGASDFEIMDFDKDGNLDIAIACGDNGDYSVIPKPYHGIHIFVNDGLWNFTEKAFLPMNGCTGIRASDYDQDGDIDIAAIAYFANFNEIPNKSFVLFENYGKMKFDGHISLDTDIGRWLIFDNADINKDGFDDLILGSCITTLRDVKPKKQQYWEDKNINYLILENKKKKSNIKP